jgi:DUF971 family protein
MNPTAEQSPWPIDLAYSRSRRTLEVNFEGGLRYSLPAELLRVESPSAEVRNHGGPKTLVAGKRLVSITRIDPVGHYGVRLVFDDGHDTGLYTWSFLYELGRDQDQIWAEYLARLEAAGKSRG